jgi:hypothetical protein
MRGHKSVIILESVMFKNNENKGNRPVKEFGTGITKAFGFIISFVFCSFFIISTIVTIKDGHLIYGILYLLLAILVLVPHHRLRVTSVLKYIIISILFVLVAFLNGRSNPLVEQKYEYFKLNDTVNLTVGNKIFPTIVHKVGQETKIMLGGNVVTTTGYFLIVDGDITNTGLEAINFKFPTNPALKDAQGRTYSLRAITASELKLQPSVTTSFSFVFEVPKDSTGLSFIIKDSTDIAKSVDLKR